MVKFKLAAVMMVLLCFVLLGFNLTRDKEGRLIEISREYKN